VSNLKDSLKKKVKGPSAIDVLTSPITMKSDQQEAEEEKEGLQSLQSTQGKQSNSELQSKQDNQGLQSKQELPGIQSLHDKQSNNDLQSKQSKQGLQNKRSKQSKQSLQSKQSNTAKVTSSNGLSEGWIRATFIMREDNLEKVKDFAYWERLQIKEVIDEALENYFEDKKVRKRPDKRGG
jgi:hypothetical protein